MTESFSRGLDRHLGDRRTFLTVGLDPRPGGLPAPLADLPETEGLRSFLRGIVEATREHCVAYKLQFASYLAFGVEGIRILSEVRKEIGKDHLVMLDLKAADIPSTMELYRTGVMDRLGFDAMTVNPFLGWETIETLLKEDGKGFFVLLHTSNAGAKDLQEAKLEKGEVLWQSLIPPLRALARTGNVGAVVGATYPAALTEVRAGLGGTVPLLVPGIGKQGGSLEEVLTRAKGEGHGALLINASRSILEASRGPDWKEAAGAEAARLTRAMQGAFR